MWFKKHWLALLAVALQAESLWKFLKWALDWRGRYDALAATYHEIGGANAMIGYILDPPPWFYPLAFLVGLILIRWDFSRNRRNVHEHAAIEASVSPVNAPDVTDLDLAPCTLALDWGTESIPTASLPNKVLTILEITTAFGDGMVIETTIPANRQKLWPRDSLGFRCELTNYGEKTVFNVDLLFHLTVREAVRDTKDPRRLNEGVTKPSKDYIFTIAKIDSGIDQSIVFYIFNRSPNFALVIPNETATLQQLGTGGRKTVQVMYSKKPGDTMAFFPIPLLPMK